MSNLITVLFIAGFGSLLNRANAEDVKKPNTQGEEQTIPQVKQGEATDDQAASRNDQAKRDHHTTEQSSAGDQGTVNESQDPLASQTTPHDKDKIDQQNRAEPSTK